MAKTRLDQALTLQKLVGSRSQAESYIKLGKVRVNGQVITKPGQLVNIEDKLSLSQDERYVSRAGLKLASVAKIFQLNFKNKLVLDVGSSTGGFSDYALKNGARKVIAVDIGTDQMHPSLRGNERLKLHEKTDIRGFRLKNIPDIILIDVSFISLRQILDSLTGLANEHTQIVALLKPQFEAGVAALNKGVIKNDKLRRQVLKDFEAWSKKLFVTLGKADSQVAGAKGNRERFYLLRKI